MHLVGILFPHINDDARSKSHQMCMCQTGKNNSREILFNSVASSWHFISTY